MVRKGGVVRLTIDLPDESAERLRTQAGLRGMKLEDLLRDIACQTADEAIEPQDAHLAVERILEIRKRVKPDPEGWTIRQYIEYGRR